MASKNKRFKLSVIYQCDLYEEFADIIKDIDNWEDGTERFTERDPKIYDKRVCECGEIFYHRMSKINVGIYCSARCGSRYKKRKKYTKRTKRKIKCQECMIDFYHVEDRSFCSMGCYHNSMRRDK